MKLQDLCLTTTAISLTLLLTYLLAGPLRDPQEVQTLGAHLWGILRHGDWAHLGMNGLLIVVGGVMTERAIGAVRTVLLAAVCTIVGIIVQYLVEGPGFIGASGIAYGLVCFGLITTSPPERRDINALMILAALAAEVAFLRQELAVFTHLGSSLTGGGIAMFASLFGNKGAQLKPMEWKHLADAIAIINQTDEDDALEAEQIFLESGYANMYVLVERGKVLGLTGFGMDDLVHDVAWLSWTYLDEQFLGQGYGAQMLNDLLGMLAKQGVRKIFIETSDYEEDGEKIYASAHRLYEEFGANVELTIANYHAPDEAKIIYGIDNPEAASTDPFEAGEDTGFMVTGIEKAPETKDVAGLEWAEAPVGVAGLDFYTDQMRSSGFREGILAIPHDLSEPNEDKLTGFGFTRLGQLKDYYGTDQAQVWWSYLVPSK